MIKILTRNIILASSSPRRREILSKMGYVFQVVPPDHDESYLDDENPIEHAKRLAREKALLVADRYQDDLVVGADTIVVLDNRILGKPSSKDEAIETLKTLSGKTHTVHTAISLVIINENKVKTACDSTKVVFNDLNEEDIRKYVESGEPMDKAGAYGIQGMGSFLVNHYEGNFDTVIGFPSKLFEKLYREVTS